MTGPEGIEWRPSALSEAFARLGWYVATAVLFVGAAWGLFRDEPTRLNSGQVNLLVFVPLLVGVLGTLSTVPVVMALVRRPAVAANYYGLTVRPGAGRLLVLPWAQLRAVAAYRVGDEAYLFLGRTQVPLPSGDRPGWADQKVMREARRGARHEGGVDLATLADFELAVRMSDFVGEPYALLATLVAFAPDHVLVASDLAAES